jgi:hypothetical protein
LKLSEIAERRGDRLPLPLADLLRSDMAPSAAADAVLLGVGTVLSVDERPREWASKSLET